MKKSGYRSTYFVAQFLMVIITCGCQEEPLFTIPVEPAMEDMNPSWSFDGNQIAYFSGHDSIGNFVPGIFITESSGTQKTAVKNMRFLAKWLPGDSELILNNGFAETIGFSKLNLRTGLITVLDSSSQIKSFDISHDGKYLYYERLFPDSVVSSAIYRYSLDSGTTTFVIAGSSPAISDDGRKLAFCKNGLQVLDINDSTLVTLAATAFYAAWMPDGQRIFYSTWTGGPNPGNIYSVGISGDSTVCLVSGAYSSLDISPDGTKLLFSFSANRTLRLCYCSLDGSGVTQITY